MGGVHKEIESNIVLEDVETDSIWSMLVFSGYLNAAEVTVEEGRFLCKLEIPNLEVRTFFDKTIASWVRKQTGASGLKPLQEALLNEDVDRLADCFSRMVMSVLSFHDTAGAEPERVVSRLYAGDVGRLARKPPGHIQP